MTFKIHIIVIILFINIVYSALELRKKVETVVGNIAELPCNVTSQKEDDKLNTLAWYKDGNSTAFSSLDLRGGDGNSITMPDIRYKLVTTDVGVDYLQIDPVDTSDAGSYQCVVDFAASPTLKTFVELVVIDPPHHLWVIHENGTQVAKASAGANTSQNIGPYYVGDTVHLLCVAFGGKPKTSISWWTEQRLLKNTSSPLSELRVRSDLRYGPLRGEDHGRVLSCLASNNQLTPALSVDVIIDMILPPDLVTVRAKNLMSSGSTSGWLVGRSTELRTGDKLLLQCHVIGAHPPPTITWRADAAEIVDLVQNVTVEPSQRFVVSEVLMTPKHDLDESQITCCVPANRRDDESPLCSAPLALTVLYPPVLKIFVDQETDNGTLAVVKGSSLSLGCSYVANPKVDELVWFHEDDLVSENKNNNTIVLDLKDIQTSDAGEYVCAGINIEGRTYSDPLNIEVTYSAYCEDATTMEYGVGESEAVNLTCKVKANPEPTSFRWVIVNEAVNASTMKNYAHTTVETSEATLSYERPNDTAYNTVFCWGVNGIVSKSTDQTPCIFLVTDETVPRPPTDCTATKTMSHDMVIKCEKGHDGGLSQKFKFFVTSLDKEDLYVSIVNVDPKFIIPEPKQDKYKFVVIAFNEKGVSQAVEITQDEIVDETEVPEAPISAVTNITTLSLALCGGVALIALAACGLVLCAHERGSRLDLPRALSDPPLCAYNTEETNCEAYPGSEDGSECNVRRTESFRRAMAKYPSRNFDVRRTSSFHSTRYMNDVPDESMNKYNDVVRHSPNCRVHSLQNISRKREMDALCDHLVLHLPPEPNYNVPRPMNTFYTMPRKNRHKLTKELSDEASEMTQTSDGFSLPPPPDEFGTYRAGTRIKDMPTKSTPTYTTIVRKNSGKESVKQQYSNTIMSPMNTVGLPTISGGQASLYTYPDDHGHPVTTNPFDEDST